MGKTGKAIKTAYRLDFKGNPDAAPCQPDTDVVWPAGLCQCSPAGQRQVKDERGNAHIKGDFHGHPWGPSPMSDKDRRPSNPIYFVRIQFDSRCQIMKLIPHLKEDRPGELFVRQGKNGSSSGISFPKIKPQAL